MSFTCPDHGQAASCPTCALKTEFHRQEGLLTTIRAQAAELDHLGRENERLEKALAEARESADYFATENESQCEMRLVKERDRLRKDYCDQKEKLALAMGVVHAMRDAVNFACCGCVPICRCEKVPEIMRDHFIDVLAKLDAMETT